jgi:uncharacterized membrane protein
MQSRPAWTWIVLVVGVVLALISIVADQIGLGSMPGFGWKQTLGLIVGVVLAVLAVWRMR